MLEQLRPASIFSIYDFERVLSWSPRCYLLTFFLLRGDSLKEIKRGLGISESTLRREVKKINGKRERVWLDKI